MKKRIIRIQVRQLAKDDLSVVVKQTINMVEAHQVESSQVKLMLDRLKTLQTEIDQLPPTRVKPRSNDGLKKFEVRFRALIGAIVLAVKAIDKDSIDGHTEEESKVVKFVEQHLGWISKTKDGRLAERARKMMIALESDASLKSAVAAVGLKRYTDKMERLLVEYSAKLTANLEKTDARNRSFTNEVKIDTGRALRNLLDSVELANEEYQTEVYEVMIESLNNLFVKVNSTIKAMTTRRMNAQTDNNEETTVESSGKTTSTAV